MTTATKTGPLAWALRSRPAAPPPPATAIAAVGDDVEALPFELAARGPAFDGEALATIRAAVEDAGAALVTVPVAGPRWRVFVREDDCLVSVLSADVDDVARAVESVRALARECREAQA